MTGPVTISAAGNTMAPALASLRALGYVVSRVVGESPLYRAENALCSFTAEDPLLLLGLVKLYELRGKSWQASDAELEALLALEDNRANSSVERDATQVRFARLLAPLTFFR